VESAIFLFTRRVLAFFRVNSAKSSINPIFFIRGACFDPSSGQPRVNPGKQEGGDVKKKNRRVFFSRYLAANDGEITFIIRYYSFDEGFTRFMILIHFEMIQILSIPNIRILERVRIRVKDLARWRSCSTVDTRGTWRLDNFHHQVLFF